MSESNASGHRYFLNKTYGGALREIASSKWDGSLPAELRYPLDVISAAEPHLNARGLHFHFTKDAHRLPEYGPHVVAVLLQEERCKLPVYGRHIRATIRNCGSKPFLGFRPRLGGGHLEAVLLFEYLRDWYTHNKSVRAAGHPPSEMGAAVQPTAHVISLPLGYHSQEELPQVGMQDRPLDCFFAGQIRHELPKGDYRRFTSTSKFVAREQCWNEMQRLAKDASWKIDLGDIASTQSKSHATAFNSYSEKMMRTRICVAPRGSIAETYRAYEGLRAGCLVVANRMPEDDFLRGAPILQIDHWRELGAILARYARNIPLLEEARLRSLAFWKERLAPQIVALGTARALNQAGASLTGR